MAGGPSGGGGWKNLTAFLNDQFSELGKRRQLARLFVDKHGSDGGGGGSPGKAYKFGRFVDQGALLAKDRQRSRFLIDAGTNRWDKPSLELLEEVIKHSLTNTPDPKQITFKLDEDVNAAKATVSVIGLVPDTDINKPPKQVGITQRNDSSIALATSFSITVTCPLPDV